MAINHHREMRTISFVGNAENAVAIAGWGGKEFSYYVKTIHLSVS